MGKGQYQKRALKRLEKFDSSLSMLTLEVSPITNEMSAMMSFSASTEIEVQPREAFVVRLCFLGGTSLQSAHNTSSRRSAYWSA
ncbi:hypothetical protein GUJ93_ZPchr0007g3629 [Zizania palustris]|uniref:Uncharacterized protein n=1 Tax=Zizania palustris TaxID=103762 RepID=A0A8J5TIL2_ZIZPA|nr:hypothetical protein GUJ93_ZPchr0007g3629 [Zizania palustris]